jgi:hypothetical protein
VSERRYGSGRVYRVLWPVGFLGLAMVQFGARHGSARRIAAGQAGLRTWHKAPTGYQRGRAIDDVVVGPAAEG